MRYLFRLSIVISLFIVAFIAYTPARAADTTITDCTFANLSAAVTAANTGGGTIDFVCSTSPTTIVFTNQLTIDASVTINDGGVVTFNGNNATRLFTVNSTGSLTLDGLTLQNGLANVGGAIFNNSGTVNISNSTLSSNFASFSGGAIFNNFNSTMNITNSIITYNSAGDGSAIYVESGNITSSQDTHYEGNGSNNICLGTLLITDNGGNTRINAGGCPGSTPVNLSVSALTCNGNNAEFTINGGDANFDITGTGAGLDILDSPAGLITLTGPATWTGITVTERRGQRQSQPLGGITCPSGVIIPPVIPPAPSVPVVTVLGCALDTADGVEVAGAPDNTYCRVLMQNGAVVSYSGAIPADLIGLGVILAVDVYRLEGGQTINTFPDYARVCLAGQGRLFYMDGRNAPRYSVELARESVDGLTCGWIPAPGTLILTN